MNKYEPITRENFFNQFEETHPKGLKHFCEWIDEYKKTVNWKQIFGTELKFHDLPFEMQVGILSRYEAENDPYYIERAEDNMLEMRKAVTVAIERLIGIMNEVPAPPKRVTQWFTFGHGHETPNHWVRIEGNSTDECRDAMFKKYGNKWSMQYSKEPEKRFCPYGELEFINL